jgi:hypothetical protein
MTVAQKMLYKRNLELMYAVSGVRPYRPIVEVEVGGLEHGAHVVKHK